MHETRLSYYSGKIITIINQRESHYVLGNPTSLKLELPDKNYVLILCCSLEYYLLTLAVEIV
jgi:hypothetical protein